MGEREENDPRAETQNFDWVKARAKCSMDIVFQVVCSEIESDVRRRNEQLSPLLTPFSSRRDDGELVILRSTRTTHKERRFSRTENGILVSDDKDKKPILEAVLTLCDDGRCRLRIGAVECEFWQFRRRALESLLFDPEV